MNNQVYIHYGSTHFDRRRFKPIKNRMYINKPTGGFWASPVNAKFGWDKWCEQEQYAVCDEENSFKFTLLDNANVYHIYSKSDILKLPLQDSLASYLCPDFEKIISLGYDGIELHLSKEIEPEDYNDCLYMALYGWDCDSILIMNPNIIAPLSSSIN